MLCPLCNGIGAEPAYCNTCGGTVTECGRSSDWMGPYEPYAPLSEDLRNVTPGGAAVYCCHVVYCGSCGLMNEVLIPEWPNNN